MQLRRKLLILLVSVLPVAVLAAKKAQPVLDWKTGILWESPDACSDSALVWKETFLILADDIKYHVAHSILVGRKPNVTEGSPVKYAIAQGGFYLQDEDGRLFKLVVVKKEQDPTAQQLLKSGKLPCQP